MGVLKPSKTSVLAGGSKDQLRKSGQRQAVQQSCVQYGSSTTSFFSSTVQRVAENSNTKAAFFSAQRASYRRHRRFGS